MVFPPQPPRPPGPPGGQPPSGPGGMPAPLGPPPQRIPQQPSQSLRAVDPGAIAGCLYRYTYVWLITGRSFWYYPTYVGRTSVAGYRWDGRFWVYYGIDLNRIASFTCYY